MGHGDKYHTYTLKYKSNNEIKDEENLIRRDDYNGELPAAGGDSIACPGESGWPLKNYYKHMKRAADRLHRHFNHLAAPILLRNEKSQKN